ncbi:WcbI family polysaccharide biosynthesis putative acetyltransferase [Rhodococcus sovatensis]|uniref:WcbI family polysaccharide biosynthesis putative acetyltransferase n=1 Tax=Rhodococcus sovatensis TaxID=1805840 RepID=A0ABZ2PCI7_9NOCA
METTEYYSERRPVSVGEIDGRTRHYGEFYGIDEPADDRPVLLVWGNCQAEALRIVLSSCSDLPYRTLRVPPVHELTRTDMPFVEHAANSAAVFASQPIRAGYRGLPIGTADMLGRPRSQQKSIVWPVIRYGGLYPFQVIVRHPSDPSAVPPGVPYHDLRTVISVVEARTEFDEWAVDIASERLRAAAEWSVEQLSMRERRDCDVGISDVLLGLGDKAAHTINHPGNEVLGELGSRILGALGCADPVLPQRELLGNIRAPLEARIIDALKLDARVREAWCVDGESVGQKSIYAAQTRWYQIHPEFVDAALSRYAELIDILGLTS